jgi:tetratricopeptide (TPR) repeat protein
MSEHRNRNATRSCRCRRVGWTLVLALFGLGTLGALSDEVALGDSAWDRRAEGEQEGRPLPEAVLGAVRSYERALATRPESLEARWKLLRALHFAGDFVPQSQAKKLEIFERARSASEQGLEGLSDRISPRKKLEELEIETLIGLLEATGTSRQAVARLYFWSAINWGAWSREAGLLSAVRKGVANRLHRYTLIAIALEPGYDEGGAFRLLGRLHAELPRVPFLSGWVEQKEALPLLERAYALAPDNPGNRLLLGLTLLDLAPERRAEALELLQQVGQLVPRPSMRIEDISMREEARKRLAAADIGEDRERSGS